MIWLHLLGFAPMIGAVVWHLCEVFAPLLLPEAEITAEARERIAIYGEDALRVVIIDEDSAWRHSRTYEQYRLRRIGRKIAALNDEA